MGGLDLLAAPPRPGRGHDGLPPPTGTALEVGAANLAFIVPEVLGGERIAIGLLAVFTLACFAARKVAAFRLFAYIGVALVTLLVNPWLTNVVGRYLTGSITYERVFWLLPVPVAVGLCVANAKQWFEAKLSAREATLLACACLLMFYVATVERLVIGEANRAWLQFPPVLKVGPVARKVAEELCRIAPARQDDRRFRNDIPAARHDSGLRYACDRRDPLDGSAQRGEVGAPQPATIRQRARRPPAQARNYVSRGPRALSSLRARDDAAGAQEPKRESDPTGQRLREDLGRREAPHLAA